MKTGFTFGAAVSGFIALGAIGAAAQDLPATIV